MKHTAVKLTVLLAAGTLITGCAGLLAGAAAGAGTAVYVKGQHQEVIEASVPEVRDATVAALRDSGIDVEEVDGDDFGADISGEMADGTSVWIDLERQTASTTQVGVRVGATGDREESEAIVDRIKNRLPAA